MHELGHVLGYDHEDEGLMDESLPLGTRRLPSGDPLEWSVNEVSTALLGDNRSARDATDTVFASFVD